MPLSITGYVLCPVRVGSSNSPFTLTPDNYVGTPFPALETVPRAEYLVQVLTEATGAGSGPGGRTVLPDATFGWTKNEGLVQGGLQVPFQRFDYADQDGRFKTLLGAPRELVGVLSLSANGTRLVVTPPTLLNLASFPLRIAVGASGSGTTFSVTLVSGAFGSPSAGVVELDTTNGQLNWNAGDLSTFDGAPVHFQRQAFYSPKDSTGDLGAVGTLLLLNPLPATGQSPALKIGERSYLTPVERATESAFSSNPAAGTVEWARTTGGLKLNATDSVTFSGQSLIYEGAFLGTFQVPRQTIGLAQGTPAGTLALYAPEGSDLYFRIPGVVQFPSTLFVDSFTSGTAGQVQVRRSDQKVQLSAADRAKYSGQTVQAVSPDIELDRGTVLRLFRPIVDPGATDPTVKDVTATYTQVAATLADPVVGQPFVTLPALPLEDQALTVSVKQGTGSFVGTLARLDGASPPAGKGYLLDVDNRQLVLAERTLDEVLPTPAFDFGMTALPDVPVFSTGLVIELETSPGSNTYETLTENERFTIDLGSGVVTYTETDGELLASGTAVSATGATLTVAEDLSLAGVAAGDSLLVESGASAGLYSVLVVPTSSHATVSPGFPVSATNVPYEIRRGREVLVDRFFREIPKIDPNTSVERLVRLGGITNGPRLAINASLAAVSRFRFGKTNFSAATSLVGVFTAPGLLATGVVEVLEGTGELNFSQADVTAGGDIYWSRELTLGVEYSVQPALGFVEFAERMLEKEEVYLRYIVFDDAGNEVPVEERGAFLVSKEVTQPHPSPSSTLIFNPEGREVAATPAPAAFRGGRPQSAAQVSFDTTASTVTFQSDDQVTEALPHGSTVSPNETVYVDYYVHEAIGGEKNLSVSQTPMATVQIVIATEDDAGNPLTSFRIKGDRTADFSDSSLLRIAGSEGYLLATPTFDGTFTTVQLAQSPAQSFRSDLTNPTLEVTSGATRRAAVGALASYFTVETSSYDTIARGSKQVKIEGDVARIYVAGIALCLTDAFTYQEYLLVEGSSYDADTNRTAVVLSTGVSRQHSTSTLLRSVRPILNDATGSATTSKAPLLTMPFQVYRQIEGEVGQLLARGTDYTLDDSGLFSFTTPLGLNEEIGILYTGASIIAAGRRTRASWTFALVPTLANGLLNQVLTMDYSTYAPDTFFYRLETMTNYRGELVAQLEADAKANSPSQGPILENSSSQKLFDKGAASLFFNERDLANQDLVARPTLKFYNDVINDLEDWLEGWDGRAVGDHDGRFLFDGLIDNPVRASFAAATNQIDDRIQVKSRVRKAFEAAPYSRFYPTRRSRYGAADDPSTLSTGDPILDLGETALRQVSSIRNRSPWAVVTTASTGGVTLQVDHAQGDPELLRPGLDVAGSLRVAIVNRDNTPIVPDSAPLLVSSTTATSVTFTTSAPAVPAGATIRMATTDDTYRKNYLLGFDVGVDLDNGFLTHIEASDAPPAPPFPPNTSPAAGTPLDVLCQVGATNTSAERFPALDGGTTDDDGDRQFPILDGDPRAELLCLDRELALIEAGGTLRVLTTDSLIGMGTLSGAGATLTNATAWPVPVPKVGDLVRLLTSTEGTSYYHRISAVGTATITVEPAFNAPSGVVDFEITRGLPKVSRPGTLTTTTTLTDAGGNFVANGVKPGHTVVGLDATFQGQRRQVLSVDSATQLTLTSGFTATGAITYQVVDSLATFGGTGSLQADWDSVISDELRALEGQDFIDFSNVLVKEATTQTLTLTGISMGSFDALLVFVALNNNNSGSLALTAATFNGSPLVQRQAAATPGSNMASYVYTATAVSGVSGNLVITATDTSVSLKVFALKLSSLKALTVAQGIQTVAPATVTPSTTLVSREAGDLVLSFGCSRVVANHLYPIQTHATLIPEFNGSGIMAVLTATRAAAGKQNVAADFRVEGTTNDTSLVATVVISKDVASDVLPGQVAPEKAALEAFFDSVAPDRGLGDLVGNITSSSAIGGDFTNVAAGAVLYVRHGPNNGVYTVASATDTSATVVEPFPHAPEASVVYRAGTLAIPAITTLQTAFSVLRNVDLAIVNAGNLKLQQHCPILVYRSGAPATSLPGTSDSSFTSVGGVLTVTGARARPLPSLATREMFLSGRASGTDATALEGVLTQDQLYDGRYEWIDGRINLETGILPKTTRAVKNRQDALQRTLANLTKLLTM